MSRTEKLRRWAKRLRVEEGRLRDIAAAMEGGDFRLNAREIRLCAGKVGQMSIGLDCLASHLRDARGSKRRAKPQGADGG